jgi:hypothetical protein
LGATAISRFQYGHENQKLYWDFVIPYNNIVQIVSWIPILPLLFLMTAAENKINSRRNWPYALLFVLASLCRMGYMVYFIQWTETTLPKE